MNTRARIIAIPYALVRVPLTIVDRAVVQQLPAGSRPRTMFDHALGVADHWVGLILAHPEIVTRGRARIEHAGRFNARVVDAPQQLSTSTSAKTYATTRVIPRSGPRSRPIVN